MPDGLIPLSVIVPAYRPESFDALRESMRANTNVDAEWIVVDDGSGPDYDLVFQSLKDTPVHVIRHEQNNRQGAARNAGLAQARGHWIKFLDSDDVLDEGHLAALLVATDQGDAIPFAPTRHVFPRGTTSINDSWRDLNRENQAQLARHLWAPFMHHCGALFPRSLLEELGGYDEALATDEDGDLLARILISGHHFAAVPQVQYHYMHHDGSRVSSDVGSAKLTARLRVCDKIERAFEGRNMPAEVRVGLALRLDRIALSYWLEDRKAARVVLARAQRLSPGYAMPGPWFARVLRRLTGPSTQVRASRLYRWLRGRPRGGAQG